MARELGGRSYEGMIIPGTDMAQVDTTAEVDLTTLFPHKIVRAIIVPTNGTINLTFNTTDENGDPLVRDVDDIPVLTGLPLPICPTKIRTGGTASTAHVFVIF